MQPVISSRSLRMRVFKRLFGQQVSQKKIGRHGVRSRRLEIETLEDCCTVSTLYGILPTTTLSRFDIAAPASIQSSVASSGLQFGENIVGIDFRPGTGQLFAIGVIDNGATDTVRLYRINPLTGVGTQVGASAVSSTITSGDFVY